MHRIEEIDDYLEFVLCFPRERCASKILEYRVNVLKKYCIETIIEYGKPFLGYPILGKGYSSIIVLALTTTKQLIALKIRRLDSRRSSLEYEGMILDYLNPTRIPPAIVFWTRDFIGMEPILCTSIEKYLDELLLSKNINELKFIIRRILSALYLIDQMEIDHGELNRPYNHIFYCYDTKEVKIIDWESARPSSKPHNFTMFTSWIFYRYKRKNEVVDLLGVSREEVIEKLREYKHGKTTSVFRWFIRLLGQP